jgi:hypothetical protein
MRRMRSLDLVMGIAFLYLAAACAGRPARGDLIRSSPERSFPDIAGDLEGRQRYTYDPITQTGTFEVRNAPHLISLGPSTNEMVRLDPDQDGTLSQSLQIKLDRFGRLVPSPDNKFQIRGTVVIGERIYQGLLLEGRPTAFGALSGEAAARGRRTGREAFDLNMEITDGKLANAFGREAYLRIVPQEESTFQGEFTADFSSDKPLTSLRAARKKMPATVPEPTALFTLLAFGAGVLGYRLRRRMPRRTRGRRSLGPEPTTVAWPAIRPS